MQDLTLLTDEALVSLYARGKDEAFDILLGRHQSSVYSYIYYLVHNREVAEDIFQDAFSKAIVTIRQGRYTESGKFKAWITRIAHNLSIDHFRQGRAERTTSNDETEYDLLNDMSLCEKNVEDSMVDGQIRADLVKLIHALPDNQREVILMRYYQDLSFKEIAEQTHVSINTALGRMRYALINIRRLAAENNVMLFAR